MHISKVRSVTLDDWEPEMQKVTCVEVGEGWEEVGERRWRGEVGGKEFEWEKMEGGEEVGGEREGMGERGGEGSRGGGERGEERPVIVQSARMLH